MDNKKALTEYLMGFITERRKNLILEKSALRTRHLTVVVENLFQDHNLSAVMRSADCFGVQDIHVVENSYSYRINDEIALGAEQWLSVNRYGKHENNTAECLKGLKQKGYVIAATTPHKDDVNLEDYDFSKPTALVFGTEKEGLSSTALEMADVFVKVPMVGFTESLNISVCAAVCMHHLTWKMRTSETDYLLNEEERLDLMYDWVRKTLKDPDGLEKVWRDAQG